MFPAAMDAAFRTALLAAANRFTPPGSPAGMPPR